LAERRPALAIDNQRLATALDSSARQLAKERTFGSFQTGAWESLHLASKRIKKRVARPQRLTGRKYWLTVGTLAAYSATSSGKLAIAQQTNPVRNSSAAPKIEALPVRRFTIRGGALGEVLAAFTKATGITVNASTEGILDIHSAGISGTYTPPQALDKICSETGLEYIFTNNGIVVLSLRTSKTTVDVKDQAPVLSSSMPKYQQRLLDTPQTISVVQQQTMQQQATTTLRDALRNVAGISLAAGEGGAQGDNLTVRGFTARNDLFIDGMRDFGSYYRDPFNTQEVEVLQGPSSVTFGRGSTGGAVNQASKTPGLTEFIDGGLLFGSDASRRGTLDIDIPLPKLGEGAAFRLNAMGNIGDIAGRDVAENRRLGIAPSLAFGLGTATRVTVSYFHQNADDVPDYGLPWLYNQAAPVNRTNYYGLADGNFLRTYDDIGTAKVEHDVNSHVTIRDQARYANYVRDVLITEPQTNGFALGTPLDSIQVTRHEIGVNSTETFLDDQLDLIANFKTGFLKHTLVTGVEGGREMSDPRRPTYTAPTTSLVDPNPLQSLNPGATIASKVTDSALSASVYALDTVRLGEQWSFTGGVRFDRFDDTYTQTIPTAAHFERVDQKPTWRAAVVYKPVEAGSLYFDAGMSFNPSAETLSLSAGTANLPPETNMSYEFGTKWAFAKGRLTTDTSWFRTTKENAREADPTNSLLYVLAGTQRVSGMQATVRGRITSRWDMIASYAFLDSKVVSSKYYPGAIGYPLANVPRNTFSSWETYRLPKHFDLGGGANYVSSRTASSTAPLDPTTGLIKQVPGYWVFDAMISHPLGEHASVQINGFNLANRYYYDELHPAHIVLGAGRSATIGFNFHF
jgi:catecholate siderophore receptor